MKHLGTTRLLTAALLLGLALAVAPAAFAQGCPMCRTGAEAAGPEGGKAINLAILVLLIPTLSLFIGVFALALCRRETETEPPHASTPTHPHARTETVLHIRWFDTPRSPTGR